MESTELRVREDDLTALAHRTDRIALRNESQPAVVFVDDDPLGFLGADREEQKQSPLKRGGADIRHQSYPIDASDLAESEQAIREIVDSFSADTERTFYYAIAGQRAQIGGNGLDDFFDAIANFRTIYRDLDEQLEPAGERQLPGFPHEGMAVRCVGMVFVENVWLRFSTWLNENPDERFYNHTTLWVTTLEQHGPLTTMWLQDRLDHPALGRPSAVDREHTTARVKLPVGPEPLPDVHEHRLIGYREGRSPDSTLEYISCPNPYYREDRAERGQQYSRLHEAGLPRRGLSGLLEIDRIPLRPRGGSHGSDEDRYVNAQVSVTQFGDVCGPMSSAVALLSGKASAIRKDRDEQVRTGPVMGQAEQANGSVLDRLKP